MKFNTMVKKFVYFLENKREYSEKYASMIMEESTAWNKEEVLKDLVKQVGIFVEYEEVKDSKVDFNYLPFCEKFKQRELKVLTKKEQYGIITYDK